MLRGSGLSSAAFEVLIAAILDGLYNGFIVDAKTRAVIAQKVENVYFGKPWADGSMASSVGMVTIDFKEKDAKVEAIAWRFCGEGHALCVVNTGGDHGDLTDDYAAIRKESEAVAAHFGKHVLREVERRRWKAASARFAGPAATAPCCARCIITMKTPACSSRRRRFAAAICPRSSTR